VGRESVSEEKPIVCNDAVLKRHTTHTLSRVLINVQKLNKVARRLEKKQEAKEPIMFKNVFFTEAEYCTAGTGTSAT
jgi:hypothetical protein